MFVLGMAGFFNDFVMPAAWAGTMDIGGRYAGTVSGAMNMMGSIAGASSVLVVGYLLTWTGNWTLTFYISAAIYLVGAVCWLFLDSHTPDRAAGRSGMRRKPRAPCEYDLSPARLTCTFEESADGQSCSTNFALDGKVALVTGGARGLGRTLATALAEAGADVALTGRTLEACEQSGVRDRRGHRPPLPRLSGRRHDSRRRRTARGGRRGATSAAIDILVNNAGTNIRGPIEQLTEADWDTVIDTNLKGPFLCAAAIGPGMVRRGWGRVINLGSVLGVIALAGPRALRVVEGGHHQPHARARARVGGHRRDRKRASVPARSAPR